MVLAVAACAGDGGTEVADTSTSPTAATTTAAAADPQPQIEGQAAPDFVLTLGDGSAFSLSDEQKPVYLVFWAEW
jgi:hypothetical protein